MNSVIRVVNDFAIHNTFILGRALKPISTGIAGVPFCFDESRISLEKAVAESIIQASARLGGIVYFKYRGKTTKLTLGFYFRLSTANIYYLRRYLFSEAAIVEISPRNGTFIGNAPGFGPLLFSLLT